MKENLDISEDEMLEMIQDAIDEVDYDDDYDDFSQLEELSEILTEIFGEDFENSLMGMADITGKIHALSLVGLSPKDGLDYVLQMQAMEHEKDILDKGNELSLKIAKLGCVADAKSGSSL